jgi:hypothetical protein
MGKKQNSTPAPTPAPEPKSPFTSMRAVAFAGALAVLAIAIILYVRSGPGDAASAQGANAPPAASTAATAAESPAQAVIGPHPQKDLPPLPFGPVQPAAPIGVLESVYRFAAEHPEVLSYVPCYCGCERAGHLGNEDCFVASRGANGDVTGWEPHGMT